MDDSKTGAGAGAEMYCNATRYCIELTERMAVIMIGLQCALASRSLHHLCRELQFYHQTWTLLIASRKLTGNKNMT
jgi:hypothetical protein